MRLATCITCFAAAIAGCNASSLQRIFPLNQPDKCDIRAAGIMAKTPVIDGHNDLPILLRSLRNNSIYSDFEFDKETVGDTDIPRLRKGMVGGQFWSVFVPCPRNGSDFDYPNGVRDTLEQIDVTKRLIELYPDDLMYATSTKDIRKAFASGKIASMIGAEGLHQVGASIAAIRMFYELGVRYITLTHACDNPFATSCSTVVNGAPDRGLSQIGISAIHEMNRLGMMVDLSHVSLETMHDAIHHSHAPVIFSHSSAYSINPHPRNVPDSVLTKLRQTDGLIMINFYKEFISGSRNCTVDDVAKHVLHVAHVAGWDHVGLGADFNGIDAKCRGLEDSSSYPNLVAAILRREAGVGEGEIRGLLGENLLRVWGKVEEVRERLRGEKPSEKIWDGRKL